MQQRIQEIVAPYGVSVANIEPIRVGYLSENYKVVAEDGRAYFLKQYRAELTPERVADIHKSKFYFHGCGIPVIVPIRDRAGESISAHEGRLFALFPFVEGTSHPDQRLSYSEIESLACVIARTHVAGEQAPTDFIAKRASERSVADARAHGDELLAVINEKIGRDPERFDYDARAVVEHKRELLDDWQFGEETAQPFILTHSDLHGGNAFFDASGAVTHVFDFELTKYTSAAQDMIRQMTITSFDHGERDEKLRRARTFLSAYRSVRPFSDEELLAAVREFIRYRATSWWVEDEHYLHGNRRVDIFLGHDYYSMLLLIDLVKKPHEILSEFYGTHS